MHQVCMGVAHTGHAFQVHAPGVHGGSTHWVCVGGVHALGMHGGACTGHAWGVHAPGVHGGSTHQACMGGACTGCAWGVHWLSLVTTGCCP